MSLQKRNNVKIAGDGLTTLILPHGFGCDQSMWKFLLPHFVTRFRVITYDLTGAGQSDLSAYNDEKYGSLWGYAADLIEIIHEYAPGPVIVVGHSVSAMIGALAEALCPGRIGGSPCYIDSDTYTGGFALAEVHSLLDTIDDNYLLWSSSMAPLLMGEPRQAALTEKLVGSFCRTNAQIARHFARVIFLSDHREQVIGLQIPTLILQSCADPVVPVAVCEYLHSILPDSQLTIIDNMGHYPQLSAPSACSAAMDTFFEEYGLGCG